MLPVINGKGLIAFLKNLGYTVKMNIRPLIPTPPPR